MDIEKLHEAISLLSGKHDFAAFTNKKWLIDNPVNTVRTVNIEAVQGHCFMEEFADYMLDCYSVWNLVFRSQSFMFRQVCKIL